jgi:hypothetical protein
MSATDIPKEIFKFWVHSSEEDDKDTIVYRPRDFEFPPSRGRSGFEIKQNREFVLYGLNPSDRPIKVTGHFEVERPNKIKVNFHDQKIEPRILYIAACDDNVLRIKKQS